MRYLSKYSGTRIPLSTANLKIDSNSPDTFIVSTWLLPDSSFSLEEGFELAKCFGDNEAAVRRTLEKTGDLTYDVIKQPVEAYLSTASANSFESRRFLKSNEVKEQEPKFPIEGKACEERISSTAGCIISEEEPPHASSVDSNCGKFLKRSSPETKSLHVLPRATIESLLSTVPQLGLALTEQPQKVNGIQCGALLKFWFFCRDEIPLIKSFFPNLSRKGDIIVRRIGEYSFEDEETESLRYWVSAWKKGLEQLLRGEVLIIETFDSSLQLHERAYKIEESETGSDS